MWGVKISTEVIYLPDETKTEARIYLSFNTTFFSLESEDKTQKFVTSCPGAFQEIFSAKAIRTRLFPEALFIHFEYE